jgi:hypothetical protein
MKTILSTLVALGVLAGAANAQPFKPFDDITIAHPRSVSGYEQALPRVSNDDYRQALPRTSNDDYRDALPLTHETFGDITIATP